MTCACTHDRQIHGPRASRGKPHRTVALGCLADDCLCEEFRPQPEKADTMNVDLIARRFAEFRRAYRALESCLKAQGIDLKSE